MSNNTKYNIESSTSHSTRNRQQSYQDLQNNWANTGPSQYQAFNIESKRNDREIQQEHLISKDLQIPKDDYFAQQLKEFDSANSKVYFLFALCASLSFATHNYMINYALQFRDNSTTIVYAEGFGFLVIYVVYHLTQAIKNRKNHGVYWARSRSVFVNRSTGNTQYRSLLAVIIRGLLQGFALINLGYISYYSKQVDISPSVIVAIFTLASFFVAIIFYFLYGEKLNAKHILGMVSIVICVGLVTISKVARSESAYEDDQAIQNINNPSISGTQISIFLPIFLAFLQALNYTSAAISFRVALKNGYTSTQFTVDMMCILAIFYLVCFVYNHFIILNYSLFDVAYFSFGALLLFLACFTQNVALKLGKGGLATALVQTQSFFQLLIEMAVEGRIPNIYEILAILFGIGGAIIIAFAKTN